MIQELELGEVVGITDQGTLGMLRLRQVCDGGLQEVRGDMVTVIQGC